MEPKFPTGSAVKVNNRDIRHLVWYPKFESYHGKTGTVVGSEYFATYFVGGDDKPTDVYDYTIEFSNGEKLDKVPQVILEAVERSQPRHQT